MYRTAAAVLLLGALGVGTAQAWRDDSHAYRGIRVYAYGPPYRNGYFSGVKVRVDDEWRSPFRHIQRYRTRPHTWSCSSDRGRAC
jgi:hypothetical protein